MGEGLALRARLELVIRLPNAVSMHAALLVVLLVVLLGPVEVRAWLDVDVDVRHPKQSPLPLEETLSDLPLRLRVVENGAAVLPAATSAPSRRPAHLLDGDEEQLLVGDDRGVEEHSHRLGVVLDVAVGGRGCLSASVPDNDFSHALEPGEGEVGAPESAETEVGHLQHGGEGGKSKLGAGGGRSHG